jgi:hypothetical protein
MRFYECLQLQAESNGYRRYSVGCGKMGGVKMQPSLEQTGVPLAPNAMNHGLQRTPTMLTTVYFILLGLVAGACSGLVGIGGGVIMVPALVLWFGFTQQMAQGTSLAMLVLPVGILGALEYYRHGYVNLQVAGLLCLGFIIGSLFGAKLAVVLPTLMLKRIFGGTLLLLGLKMLVGL